MRDGIGAPNASTIRRALSAFTGDGFDTAIGGFLAGRLAAARTKTAKGKKGVRTRRRAIAVDGKALRGSRDGGRRARMVMACGFGSDSWFWPVFGDRPGPGRGVLRRSVTMIDCVLITVWGRCCRTWRAC